MQDMSHYKLFSYTGASIKWNRQTCLQLRLRTRAQLYKCLYNNRRLQDTATLMDKVQAAYHDYSKYPKNSQYCLRNWDFEMPRFNSTRRHGKHTDTTGSIYLVKTQQRIKRRYQLSRYLRPLQNIEEKLTFQTSMTTIKYVNREQNHFISFRRSIY